MSFFIGGAVDDGGQRIQDSHVSYDPSDLTTHGVIVGMTGSGKTGLGIIYLEEALRNDIPTLIIDPKGDMTNLLLTFPGLSAEEFRPWIDEAAARKDGKSPDQEAKDESDKWRKGLDSWGITGDDIGSMRSKTDMTIYTPGSAAGVPLNVIGHLEVPELSWDTDSEAMRDEIQGYVAGLLGLVDVDADPISSRAHILLSNLIEHSWRQGNSLDITKLITQIVTPPIRKLGVFEVDTFFPEKDRIALAMKLNGLLASPSFAAWMDGQPLDIGSLLWNEGRPQAAIVYIAHLSEPERQFIVTLLLSKVTTWMRTQSGSTELRALIYMDEVFGFVPPTAEPPSKKPILTLLKQARAFGVGLLLSTQNPVDLDYKAMSNAGTWCIGRLQTERDKARILEALSSSSGDVDMAEIDSRISNLSKRTFLLHNTNDPGPTAFTTRWAMSYLRGPMTRTEIGRVAGVGQTAEPHVPRTEDLRDEPSEAVVPPTGSSAEPQIAEGLASSALHPAATWAHAVGYIPDANSYEPAVAVTINLHFDETRAGIEHDEIWEAVIFPLTSQFDPDNVIEVDHDPRDFVDVDSDLRFAVVDAPLSQTSYFRSLESSLKKHLDRNETISVSRSKALGVTSRPDESETDFRLRLEAAADDRADADVAQLRDRYETRYRKAQRAYEDAVRTAETAEQEADDARTSAFLGIGLDLLSGRKPRLSSTQKRSADNRARKAGDKIELRRQEIEDLNADLEDDVRDIRAKWSAVITDVDVLEIGLESDDITIADTQVVWIRR